MKKFILAAVLSALGAACMFTPLPQIPTLGEVELPVAAEEETVWRSTDYQGKPVMIVFMGSWCPYCKMTMPAVNAAAKEYGEKAEIVAVFMDQNPELVRQAAKEHGLSVKALYAGGPVAQSMEVEGLPHAVLFDKKHRAVKVWEGFSPERASDFITALEKTAK